MDWEQAFLSQMNLADDLDNEMSKRYKEEYLDARNDIMAWCEAYGVSYSDSRKILNHDDLIAFRDQLEIYMDDNVSDVWKKELLVMASRSRVSRIEELELKLRHGCEKTFFQLFTSLLSLLFDSSDYYGDFTLSKLDGDIHYKGYEETDKIDGMTLKERVEYNKSKLISELNRELVMGLVRGESGRKISSRVKERLRVSESRTKNISQTSESWVLNDVQSNVMKAMKVKLYKISAFLDGRTCQHCRTMNGKIFNLSDLEVGVNAPPFHNNCRCIKIPVR